MLLIVDSEAQSESTESPFSNSMFRPGHNLTLLMLLEQSHWQVQNSENIDGFARRELSPAASLRYSFHINLFGGLGFALGTAVAGFFPGDDLAPSELRKTRGAKFRPGYALQFPSLSAALVQNVGQDVRLSGQVDYAALYMPSMRIRTKPRESLGEDSREAAGDRELGREVAMTVVPDSWSVGLQTDFFVTPLFGIALYAGYRSVLSSCLGGCSSSAFVNSVRFDTEVWQLGCGVTWQAGTFFDE